MKFNSQLCTTKIQSERLLAMGLKKETADMCYKTTTHDFRGNEIKESDRYYSMCCWYDESNQVCGLERKETIPAWSLHRLIEITDMRAFSPTSTLEGWYDDIIAQIQSLIHLGYIKKEYLDMDIVNANEGKNTELLKNEGK